MQHLGNFCKMRHHIRAHRHVLTRKLTWTYGQTRSLGGTVVRKSSFIESLFVSSITIGTQASIAHFERKKVIILRVLPSRYFWNLWRFLYCSDTPHLPSRNRHSIYYFRPSLCSVPRKYSRFPLLQRPRTRKSWFFWVIAISCNLRAGSKIFWGRRRSKTANRRCMADTLIYCSSNSATFRTCYETYGGRPCHLFSRRETSGYAPYPSPRYKSDFVQSRGPIRCKASHCRVISFHVRRRRRIRPDNAPVLRPTQTYR